MTARLAAVTSLPSDLIADLKQLGLSEYEARVYVQLLRDSPATAYEVSKNAAVPRPNTYNALESLAQRGAVIPVSEGPTRFVPAPPAEFFGAIARQTDALCDSVRQRLDQVTQPVSDQNVWPLRGDVQVHDKIAAMIDASQKMLMIKASDEVLLRHVDVLRAAAARGVGMLIVLFGTDKSPFEFNDRCRVYLHEGNGVRMGKTDNLFTIAADHAEMLTATTLDEVMAVHTRNEPIVNMAESLVRHDFYMAEIFLRFGDQIYDTFGLYLRDLRLACFTPEQAASFRAKTGFAEPGAGPAA
ncbi:MAG: TrmB family transcriptional regulator [Rhodobacterales bacterium]|nr:TrmB family transcriptional regulator [Rhodobacterales bacterium]